MLLVEKNMQRSSQANLFNFVQLEFQFVNLLSYLNRTVVCKQNVCQKQLRLCSQNLWVNTFCVFIGKASAAYAIHSHRSPLPDGGQTSVLFFLYGNAQQTLHSHTESHRKKTDTAFALWQMANVSHYMAIKRHMMEVYLR